MRFQKRWNYNRAKQDPNPRDINRPVQGCKDPVHKTEIQEGNSMRPRPNQTISGMRVELKMLKFLRFEQIHGDFRSKEKTDIDAG